MYTPEKRMIKKYTRKDIRISNEYIQSLNKWITDRDIKILDLLLRHPFLTIEQLEMMAFSNLKPSSWRNKANERIRRLYHAHCIDRWFPPVEDGAGSAQQHIVLDRAGYQLLALHGLSKDREGNEIRWKKRKYIPQTYQHSLKIFDFKAMLHVLDKQIGAGEIIQWKTEHETKLTYTESGRRKEVIPDAFCIYKYNQAGRVKIFFLECDNATMDLEEQLKPKIRRYHEMYQSGSWRIESWATLLRTFPAVVIIMHTEEDVDGLYRFIRSLRSNIKFLLTTYDKLVSEEYVSYQNHLGKRRDVLSSIRVNILDPIWKSNIGGTETVL